MAVLQQGLPRTLGDAAVRLAIDNDGVDWATDIVDRGVAEDSRRAPPGPRICRSGGYMRGDEANAPSPRKLVPAAQRR